MPSTFDYLQLLAAKITNELVISTIAGISMEWRELKHRDGNLYGVYMTGATSFAVGLAVALPHRRVISLEGDGSILMGLSILPVIAQQNPSNLVVIVFDNELYAAAGKVPSFTAGLTNLVEIARGAGTKNTKLVRRLSEFQEAIDEAFQASSASFITVKVEMSSKPRPFLKVAYAQIENKYRFIRYIEQTENLQIIRSI